MNYIQYFKQIKFYIAYVIFAYVIVGGIYSFFFADKDAAKEKQEEIKRQFRGKVIGKDDSHVFKIYTLINGENETIYNPSVELYQNVYEGDSIFKIGKEDSIIITRKNYREKVPYFDPIKPRDNKDPLFE